MFRRENSARGRMLAAGSRHVDVQGNDEGRGEHALPAARVDVVAADHPAQVEQEALAGRALGGIGEEVRADGLCSAALAGQGAQASQGAHEGREGWDDGSACAWR